MHPSVRSSNSCIAITGRTLLLANCMKFFTAEPPASFCFLWIALVSYGLFLVVAVVSRVGKGRTPLGRFNRLHFRIAAVYILLSLLYCLFNVRSCTLITAGEWLIGFFVYFGIHYAIVANFFGLAQASVSTAIISILHAHSGRATRSECMADYAGGEGFAYIKKNRLSRIQNLLNWVTVRDGRYRLTRAGQRMARLTTAMLRLWGLRQIGKTR